MPNQNVKEEDVTKLLSILESTVGEFLSKADPGSQAPGEETPEGSSATSDSDDSGPPSDSDGGSAPPSGDAGSAPPMDSASADPSAGAAPAPGGDPAADAAQGAPTVEQLTAECAALPPEELANLFQAVQAAMAQAGSAGGAPVGSPPPSAPNLGAPADASSAMKSEKEFGERLSKIRAEVGTVMAKAEQFEKAAAAKDAEIKTLKDELAKMEERFSVAAEKMLTFVGTQTAQRKSAGGVSFIPRAPGDQAEKIEKTEVKDVSGISRPDALAKLGTVARTQGAKLTKSDRDLIDGFVLRGAPVDTVAKFLQ